MSNVIQGIVKGRIANISTHDLVRQQNRGPTIHGRLDIERLAFLRAVASGIPKATAMERYFPNVPARDRKEEAESTIAVARALARRHGDTSAHLIGMDIWSVTKTKGPKASLETSFDRDAFLAHLKKVDAYVAANLEDSSDEDVYAEWVSRFGHSDEAGSKVDEDEDPKVETRKNRLVAMHVDAVRRLEKITIETPTFWDDIEDWLPVNWIAPLAAAGIKSLDDLGKKVRLGGRWYADIPDLKPGIAAKLQKYLERLLPGRYKMAEPVTMEVVATITSNAPQGPLLQPHPALSIVDAPPALPPAASPLAQPTASMIAAKDDAKAIKSWIDAVTNSETTMRSYVKESRRFVAWLAKERGGKRLEHLDIDDCLAYLTFLQNIPEGYISRRRITGDEAGGLIFRGQLTDASVAQARTIVSSMCEWLFAVGYMVRNPWRGLHKKVARTRVTSARRSKAFNDDWMTKALDHLAKEPSSPAKARMIFLMEFTTRTGLRPAEIVNARMEDVHRTDEGLFIRVIGKGEKERWCVINHAAEGALRQYLRDRNLPPLESCGKDIPLVSSTLNNTQPVGYQALHESFTAWMKNLIAVVGEHPISNNQPTLHKLRHTFATTAVKDGVPYDVIQAQLGHQDINTTISTYATAPDARRVAEINRMT